MFETIALIGFFLTGLLFVVATPLTLVVLGPQWKGAAGIFAAFTFATLSYPLSTASTWLFLSQGRGGELLVAQLWIGGFIFCSFLAGLPFGAVGVAISYSLFSIFLVLPIAFRMAGRSGPVKSADLWIAVLKHLPVWGVVFGAAWSARLAAADFRPFAQLCVCAFAGLGVGVAFIYMYNPSRKAFLSFFDALLKWRQFKRA